MENNGELLLAVSDTHYDNALDRFAGLAVSVLHDASGRSLLGEDVSHPERPDSTVEMYLPGWQPFGLIFLAGRQATFNIPARRHFIIEYLAVNRWVEGPFLFQLATRSQRMFRTMTFCCAATDLPTAEVYGLSPKSRIRLPESTTNTFLFTQGDLLRTATVPADTFVQIWGHLELSGFWPS